MTLHYHDKEPLSDKLQEMVNNQAAAKMLLDESQTEKKVVKEPNAKKIIWVIILCFVVLYLVCMLLATRQVQQNYEALYKQNTAVKLYDSKENGVPITKSYLAFETEEEGTYYFLLDEYFEKSEIESLLLYVNAQSDKYVVDAQIDNEVGELISLEISGDDTYGGSSDIVWEWQSEKADSYEEDELVTFYKRTTVKDVVVVGWEENSLQVALEIMMPVYVIGLVLMLIGVSVTIGGVSRFRKK